MSSFAIETRQLTFGFPNQPPLLQHLHLQVEKGSIYGLLGPNGAGKTTTIRLLLGLLPAPPNSVLLFGRNLANHPRELLGKVGTLIETPSLYEHLTGYDNLNITRIIRNVSPQRIGEVLEIVQLTQAAHTRVKKYSLGMKQRLALALALLSQPELLILDEPTNGLDPNGINDMRQLLLALNRNRGTTILISSHLLSEMEKMVTHLGVIHQGRLIFQGKMAELLQSAPLKPVWHLQTSDNRKAQAILQAEYSIHMNHQGTLEMLLAHPDQADGIHQRLLQHDITVWQLKAVSQDLETIYLTLTQH